MSRLRLAEILDRLAVRSGTNITTTNRKAQIAAWLDEFGHYDDVTMDRAEGILKRSQNDATATTRSGSGWPSVKELGTALATAKRGMLGEQSVKPDDFIPASLASGDFPNLVAASKLVAELVMRVLSKADAARFMAAESAVIDRGESSWMDRVVNEGQSGLDSLEQQLRDHPGAYDDGVTL